MDPGTRVATIRELSREECLELLAGAAVGRMVYTASALPAVVPVTFALDGGAAVCQTASSSRLARAAYGGVLALQTDEVDVVTRSGWSVIATGRADVLHDPAQVRRVAGLVHPWLPGPADVAIRLPLTVLTGRRVTGPAGRDLAAVAGLPTD